MPEGRLRGIGKWGEDQACCFLVRKGFRVIERNYHTTVGEIDIIARKGDDIYFVEVKTRMKGEMASDLAITRDKKIKLQKTINQYCHNEKVRDLGIIKAGLMVVVDRKEEKINFRLAVMY